MIRLPTPLIPPLRPFLRVEGLAYNGLGSSLNLWPHLHPLWLNSPLNAKPMD